MNLLICFVLALAGTAYSRINVEMRIKSLLKLFSIMKCHMTNPTSDLGSREVPFNQSRTFTFQDVDPINWEKEEMMCLLRYDRYYHDVQVYREATFSRSGILRSWEARKDGIYFKTRRNRQWEFKYYWYVGK
ncbi:unnamed protein product [Brassica napus]|uniref:(rape) hypothetical protein n=1 Tax=Brassica napus TaxID=3708 RepID=A0A816NJ99_BRANA|nr:unnamed protein product [Brassica napus]